jgi:predicted lipoprotein with Yx(FWY)xxD motif
MSGSEQQQISQPPARGRASVLAMSLVGVMLGLAVSLATVALATVGATVGSSSNATLGERVVVNAQGRTLYTLSGETARHLLCKTSECLKFWPPLTVPSRKTSLKAGPGVQGHLAILRRSDGILQVTLRGRPLYRYSHDHARGDANGQGIESFGGTWRALPAASNTPSAAPPTHTPPTMPSPAPGYGY